MTQGRNEKNRNFKKMEKKLLHYTGKAIHDFGLIEDGDRIMVCVSGGKDSLAMLELLLQLQKKAPVTFQLIAVNLDQKLPGFPKGLLSGFFELLGVPYEIIEEDTWSIVKDKVSQGKTACSLCSRLRRGILYSAARRLHCNKLALGHHRDDVLETLFLNLFFNGTMKTMPAKLLNDQQDLILIRPLIYAPEEIIDQYVKAKRYPVIPGNLCGSQAFLKRAEVKEMLEYWKQSYPDRLDSIFAGIQNVAPSHMLDRELFDFSELTPFQST